jgi:hypothetical protein
MITADATPMPRPAAVPAVRLPLPATCGVAVATSVDALVGDSRVVIDAVVAEGWATGGVWDETVLAAGREVTEVVELEDVAVVAGFIEVIEVEDFTAEDVLVLAVLLAAAAQNAVYWFLVAN